MSVVAFDDDLMDFSIAYLKDGPGDERGITGFFWLGGFMSDMTGSKGEALAALARSQRRTCLRFDYSGHGHSAGLFTDGTISQWLEQATHMFLRHTQNKRIIVGSSMGGWLALLLARRLAKEDPYAASRIGGLVLIAPATDMTSELIWPRMTDEDRHTLVRESQWQQPSGYGTPYPITLALIEDGTRHSLFSESLSFPFPVRILQGTEDEDVPVAHAIKTLDLIKADITLTLIKNGDHRLSTQPQLRIMQETVLQLAKRADGDEI